MRCILVNDAKLKAEAYCTYCRNKIGDSYIREIGSKFLYCDYACYQSGDARAVQPSGFVMPTMSAWTLSS
jgi:hypothetical protein